MSHDCGGAVARALCTKVTSPDWLKEAGQGPGAKKNVILTKVAEWGEGNHQTLTSWEWRARLLSENWKFLDGVKPERFFLLFLTLNTIGKRMISITILKDDRWML